MNKIWYVNVVTIAIGVFLGMFTLQFLEVMIQLLLTRGL